MDYATTLHNVQTRTNTHTHITLRYYTISKLTVHVRRPLHSLSCISASSLLLKCSWLTQEV